MEARGLEDARGELSEGLSVEQAAMSAVGWESVGCIVIRVFES